MFTSDDAYLAKLKQLRGVTQAVLDAQREFEAEGLSYTQDLMSAARSMQKDLEVRAGMVILRG
jgi:hypothetical protein